MLKQKILLTTILSSVLIGGCSNSNNTPSKVDQMLGNFPSSGVYLPYTVLRSDLTDAKTQQTFEIRNGGYGSSMTADPTNPTRFYALTDRGPNAKYTGSLGKGKIFPTPDYTPRIGLFEVSSSGGISLIKDILLKRPDGTPITGLPNSSALGGTGETPYDASHNPIVVDASKPYDASTNPIKLDDYGLDGEGLAVMNDNTFWVSDEYGPHMVHFNAEGIEIDRINAFANDTRTSIKLPAEFSKRRANRGMEGIAITPDQSTLVGIMQSTMYNPSSAVKALNIVRIVTVNLATKEIGQYLYRQDKAQNSNSEITALSATEFLVIERDGSFLYGGPKGAANASPAAQKKVYRIDLSTGTNLETVSLASNMVQDANLGLTINSKTLEEVVLAQDWAGLSSAGISPVKKSLVVDMVAEVSYPHDKMEGLWVIDKNHLGVLNDDDFATWATGGLLEQKMLDTNTIDGNHLYIVNVNL